MSNREMHGTIDCQVLSNREMHGTIDCQVLSNREMHGTIDFRDCKRKLNKSLAECFPEKSSWCWSEQVCLGMKCKAI